MAEKLKKDFLFYMSMPDDEAQARDKVNDHRVMFEKAIE